MKKVAVCVALTGAINNPGVPITAEEIIFNAKECYKLGASIVHIHLRDKNGKPCLDYEICKEVIAGIRESCGILINLSTSNHLIEVSDKERLSLLELKPDFASIALKSIRRDSGGIKNTHRFVLDLLHAMYANNVIPEIEIYNKSIYNKFLSLRDRGVIREKPLIQFVLGAPGGFGLNYSIVDWILKNVSNDYFWSALGVSKMQLPLNVISVLNGCDLIRTGMEDNLYLHKGVRAQSNMELVSRAVKTMTSIGYECAAPSEVIEKFKVW